jgi:5-methylcytosine-specific restriction enzyme subunit McrC
MPAFNLAKLFLAGNTPQLHIGRENISAFVFDMNILFERFITQFIIRHRMDILSEGWRNTLIHPQSQGVTCYLARRFLDDHPAVLLKPDILFTMSSTTRPWLIIDAKYKQLVTNRRSLNISNDDVHQMLAYVTRFDCPRAMLLYPNTALSDRQRQHLVIDANHSHLLINTINLRQPLQDPKPLIGELREIFQSLPLTDG